MHVHGPQDRVVLFPKLSVGLLRAHSIPSGHELNRMLQQRICAASGRRTQTWVTVTMSGATKPGAETGAQLMQGHLGEEMSAS